MMIFSIFLKPCCVLSDDIPLSKLFLSTLLKLSTQMKNLPQLLRDMMQDLHSQLGDIDRVSSVCVMRNH